MLTPLNEIFLSILKYARRIVHSLTFVTSSLHGWEAFPTTGALTHTRITWALSPTTPQVPGVTHSPPCAHDILHTPYGEVHDSMAKYVIKYLEVLIHLHEGIFTSNLLPM